MGKEHRPTGWVLGGSGFLGRAVMRRALGLGHRVTCVSRHPGEGDGEALALDLCGPGEELARALDRGAPDWIINCAALASAGACEARPDLAQELNSVLPDRLGRLCQERGLRLLHCSTDNVFDGHPPRPSGYREHDEPGPLSVYGRTKLEGEARLGAACPGALIVRLPLLFGDSEGRGLGASDGLLAAIERGERPGLFTDEHRTPLDVDQAARALVEWSSTANAGPLHLGGPERLTRFELGQHVLAGAGLDGARVRPALQREVHGVPPRAPDLTLDSRLALSQLSFVPSNPW